MNRTDPGGQTRDKVKDLHNLIGVQSYIIFGLAF